MMFSVAVIKAFQVYGITIAISMVVAILIKVMVTIMGRLERPATKAKPAVVVSPAPKSAAASAPGTPSSEVVAAITAVLSTIVGSHRILHIAQSNPGWVESGRSAHHSSHSGHFTPGI